MKEVFRVINKLVEEKVIETYAIGGAIAAMFYVEVQQTHDVDVFMPFSAGPDSGLILSLGPLYQHLAEMGYHPKGDAVGIEGWPVQFLPIPNTLVDEAVQNADIFDVEGVSVRVIPALYLVAIMLQTGRPKDLARVHTFMDQAEIDTESLSLLIERFGLEAQWQKYKMIL